MELGDTGRDVRVTWYFNISEFNGDWEVTMWDRNFPTLKGLITEFEERVGRERTTQQSGGVQKLLVNPTTVGTTN